MTHDRRPAALAALCALALSCGGSAAKKQEEPVRISAEAAAAFGHVKHDGLGGTLVVDIDALRRLGFGQGEAKGADAGFLVDLAVDLLPQLAVESKDPQAAGVLARTAVLLRLTGDWVKAPQVRRLGVLAKVDPQHPERAADGALVVLAVNEGEAENRELLHGLAAGVRAASGRELVRNEQGNVCSAREAVPELPFQVCLRAGPGFLALGTPEALGALSAPAAAPAAREPGPVLAVRALLPQVGHLELSAEGTGALRLSGAVKPDDPRVADGVEQGIRTGLAELDAQAARRRAVVAKALDEVKGALARDPDAPARLKEAAAGATVDKVVDPRGEYDALRKSVQVGRQGPTVTLEATVPEGQVRRMARFDGGMTGVATVGVLAAIAIPNFLKYQCRSKSAAGQVALRSASLVLSRKPAAKGRPPRLDAADLAQFAQERHAVCTAADCSPQASPALAAACRGALVEAGAALCAVADLQGDGKLDLWVAGPDGQPRHLRNGCE